MQRVGEEALAGVGNVVEDEARDHSELLRFADVLRDPHPRSVRPRAPPVVGAAVHVDVADVHESAIVGTVGAVPAPVVEVRGRVFADASDREAARQARNRTRRRANGDAEEARSAGRRFGQRDRCESRVARR
jgi:hypothetical protein